MTTTPEARIAEALAKHAVEYVDVTSFETAVCTCGGRFHDDTSAYDCPDDMVPHSAHLAAVIAALPDIAIMPRSLLAELVDPRPLLVRPQRRVSGARVHQPGTRRNMPRPRCKGNPRRWG